MRLVNELTMLKILVDGKGALLSITTKRRAFFLFLSAKFIGGRVAPTTDPDLGIVELCDYDIDKILANWNLLYRAKVPRGSR